MSKTSVTSIGSLRTKTRRKAMYDDDDGDDDDEDSSCCARCWFSLVNTFLIVIIMVTSGLYIYFSNKYAERDRERQRLKDEFKRKHGVANKVLDMIMKDGIVYKWIKAHKGAVATIFRELFQDIAQTLFNE